MRIISVANQKGGCGKTTTAINLAASLAFLQKKVLLIDLDPQGHSTCGLGVKAESLQKTVYNLFKEDCLTTALSDVLVSLDYGLDLIPAHVVLSAIEQELAGTEGRENKLIDRLEQLPTDYDFVIMDCPPNLGLLTFNAFRASSEMLIPIEPSFFSLHGLAKIFETIEWLRNTHGKTLRIHALITRYEKRTRLTREIESEVKKYFNHQLFRNPIRENVRLREAAAAGKSIVNFDRESTGFQDYMNLAIEVIERGISQIPISQEAVLIQKPLPLSEPAALQNASPPAFEFPVLPVETPSAETHSAESNGSLQVATEETVQIASRNGSAPHAALGGFLFAYRDQHAKEVLVAGDFNHWIGEAMTKVDPESDLWQKVVMVGAGIYRYKFLVNGEWMTDPSNPAAEPTPYGSMNSVIEVT